MKIALYAPFYPPFEGGAERVARRVARGLAGRHELTVFTLRYDPALPGEEGDGRVRVVRVPYRETRPLGLTRLVAPSLAGRILSAAPDVLQVHGVTFPNVALAAVRALRRHGVPTLLAPHGLFEAYDGGARHHPLRRLVYLATVRPLLAALARDAAHIALTSPEERAILRRLGVPADRTSLVYNGFEPPRPEAASAERFRRRHGLEGAVIVLHVASIKPNKGHDVMLAALGALAPAFPALRYVAVGGQGGPWADYARTVRAAAERGPGGGRALFLGHLPDEEVADAYAAADIAVLPSLAETFPLSVLDALAWGKPVVATEVGGVAHVIRPEESGLLVPPGDPTALAAALRRLLADAALRERLGRAAVAAVAPFSWPEVIARYEAACADLAGGRARRPAAAAGRPA